MRHIWTTDGVIELTPRSDGITHINCYSQASSQLGRDLSNFSSLGFTLPGVGKFASMEGYWHWVSTGKQHDEFLNMNGYEAKMASRNYAKVRSATFEEDICIGIRAKLKQNPELFAALNRTLLPLAHYRYAHQELVDVPGNQQFWLMELSNYRRSYDFHN